MSKLFKSKPAKTYNQSHSFLNIPDWLDEYARQVVDKAMQTGSTPFQAYTGEPIEGLSQDELDAFQLVRDRVGAGPDPLMDAAADLAMGQREFDPLPYMNPFMQGVVDIEKREALTDFDRQLQDIRAGSAMRGAFGGSRQGVMEGMAYDDIAQRLGDIQAVGSRDAYDNAVDAFFRMGDNARLLSDIGASRQSQQFQDAAILEAIGEKSRGINQARRDFDYSEFLRGQDFPFRQQDVMNQTVFSAIPALSTQVNSGVTKAHQAEGSPFSQILGAGLTAASLGMGGVFGGGAGGGLPSISSSMFRTTNTGSRYIPGAGRLFGYADGGRVGREKRERPTARNPFEDLMSIFERGEGPNLRGKAQGLTAEDLGIELRGPTGKSGRTQERINPFEEAITKNQNRIPVSPQGEMSSYVIPKGSPAEVLPSFVSPFSGYPVYSETTASSEKPKTDKSFFSKVFDDEINTPLMRMGLAMLGSKGNVAEAFSEGGTAFLDERERIAAGETERSRYDQEFALKQKEQELAESLLNLRLTALAQKAEGKPLTEKDVLELAAEIMSNSITPMTLAEAVAQVRAQANNQGISTEGSTGSSISMTMEDFEEFK